MLGQAIFGGGCFWCVEAVIQRLKGVEKVQSGYAGGHTQNPTYNQVCSKQTGHAQVVRVTYNSEILAYKDLIYIFMMTHDPTTLNFQGVDKGTQYRSIILHENEQELEVIRNVFEEAQKFYQYPIVTEVKKLDVFYMGENKHQDFYNQNKQRGYCRTIIKPKIQKLQALYAKYLNT